MLMGQALCPRVLPLRPGARRLQAKEGEQTLACQLPFESPQRSFAYRGTALR
jgi:hypothetical protein